jgi:hypothetical protein
MPEHSWQACIIALRLRLMFRRLLFFGGGVFSSRKFLSGTSNAMLLMLTVQQIGLTVLLLIRFALSTVDLLRCKMETNPSLRAIRLSICPSIISSPSCVLIHAFQTGDGILFRHQTNHNPFYPSLTFPHLSSPFGFDLV